MVKPLKGIVISNKMMKSVTVMVERIYKHPRWGKYVRGRKKYMGASEAPRRIPKSLSRSRDRKHRCRVQSFPFPPARAHSPLARSRHLFLSPFRAFSLDGPGRAPIAP